MALARTSPSGRCASCSAGWQSRYGPVFAHLVNVDPWPAANGLHVTLGVDNCPGDFGSVDWPRARSGSGQIGTWLCPGDGCQPVCPATTRDPATDAVRMANASQPILRSIRLYAATM